MAGRTVPVRRLAAVVVLTAAGWLAIGAWQLVEAVADLRSARDRADEFQSLWEATDLAETESELAATRSDLEAAARRLGGAGVAPYRVLPRVGDAIVAGAELAAAAAAAAEAGETVVAAVNDLPDGMESLAPAGGSLPLGRLSELAEPLQQADALLGRSLVHLERAEGRWAPGPLHSAQDDLNEVLPSLSDTMHRAAALSEHLPGFLGAREPRRYLFLAQNPAEARGTGGFIGAYSILTIDGGELSFSAFDEIQELPAYHVSEIIAPSEDYARRYKRYGSAGFWHNINMTPDFPTAARAMLTLYEKGIGERLDGVIATDPFALEALLEVSGPVDVKGFGTVGADEVVDVVANRAHAEIDDSLRRKQLLGAVAVGAFSGMLEGTEDPVEVVRSLAEAADGGHVPLHSDNPDEQAGFVRAEVAGALQDPEGDFLAVIGNAAHAAKLDYYLQRAVTYDVELLPGGRSESKTTVLVRNGAPASGVTHRVIGPNADGLEAGEQRLNLSVYAGKGAELGVAAGADGGVEEDTELGHPVFTGTAEVPAGASQRLSWTWSRPQGWEPAAQGGRYRLTVQGQPTVRPTRLSVTVTLPPGNRLVAVPEGVEELDGGRVRVAGPLGRKTVLDLRFAPFENTG